jgi:hypothetical protein
LHRKLAERCRLTLELLEDRLCPSALALGAPTLAPPDAGTQAQVSQAYGQLPLSFEANQGQTDPQVNFLSRGNGYSLYLTPTAAVLDLQQGAMGDDTVLTMQLVGANPAARPIGLDPLAGTVNYLIGNDPTRWHTGVATDSRVEYQGVYPGIDLIYHGNQGHLEYDFVVAPGANPAAIRLSFQGTQGLSIDAQGDLMVHTAAGDLVEQAPVLYQQNGATRQAVSGHYILERNGQVSFQVGSYDPSRPLVIDPTYSLVYSTYLGGTGTDDAYAIAVDQYGNAYVTGWTSSRDFPVTGGVLQSKYKSTDNAFVTKLNPSGTGLVYSTYLGGGGITLGSGIAVDQYGDAYVTGRTNSTSFPIKNGFQTTLGGGNYGDAFVAKLNATGSAVLYSSYLGGNSDENNVGSALAPVGGIAVDQFGNAYVTGTTASSNFPTRNGLPASAGGLGPVFVTRVNTNLAGAASLVYSTLLGGSGSVPNAYGSSIAIDGTGDVYVTGSTSSGFITTPGAFVTGGAGAFVVKLNTNLAGAAALVYATDLSSGGTAGYGIAVDGSGNAYVTGRVSYGNLPTTPNAFQTANGSVKPYSTDAFLTVLNPTGSGLIYSTYLGGSTNDEGRAIALDSAGHVYLTGDTGGNFPILNAFQSTHQGTLGYSDAFVAELDPSQSGAASLVYSSYLGGSGLDYGYGIAVDGSGNAYVTGYTGSTNFPTLNAFRPSLSGNYDAFITKIDPPLAPTTTAGTGSASGEPLSYSFGASPYPVAVGAPVTQTAGNIVALNPGATVTPAVFHQDSNGDGVPEPGTALVGYGTQSNTSTWTFAFSTTDILGEPTRSLDPALG